MDTEPATEFRPPYLAFKTFWSFIEELLAYPLPPQIDRSLMLSKSGTDQVKLTAALKAFDLIDSSQTVTGLSELAAHDEAARVHWLAMEIRKRYPAQVQISEQNGTEQQLRESFRQSFKVESADTLRKSITFFLHAARAAGIPISPHFPVTRSGSGAPGTAKPKRPAAKRKPPPETVKENGAAKVASSGGDTFSVELASGGSVSVAVSVNLFDLTKADRDFVIGLVDDLKGYSAAPTASGSEHAEAESDGTVAPAHADGAA